MRLSGLASSESPGNVIVGTRTLRNSAWANVKWAGVGRSLDTAACRASTPASGCARANVKGSLKPLNDLARPSAWSAHKTNAHLTLLDQGVHKAPAHEFHWRFHAAMVKATSRGEPQGAGTECSPSLSGPWPGATRKPAASPWAKRAVTSCRNAALAGRVDEAYAALSQRPTP